jgi:hypothetical protein
MQDALNALVIGLLPPVRIQTHCRAQASPVTQTAHCKGSRPTAKPIACLQPHRRLP